MNTKKIALISAVIVIILTGFLVFSLLGNNGDHIIYDTNIVYETTNGDWESSLTLMHIETVTIDNTRYLSSGKLLLSWNPPPDSVDHYEISASESVGTTTLTSIADGSVNSYTLSGLKSSTEYTVSIVACGGSDCNDKFISKTNALVSTAPEIWQLQGTGNTYSSCTQVVSDGNVLAYVFQYGTGVGDGLDETYKMYYKPSVNGAWGTGIRIAENTAIGTDVTSMSSFTPLDAGVKNMCSERDFDICPPDTIVLAACQAVPLSTRGVIRLFFEATRIKDPNHPTRIYYLDSQDGYTGLDFNTDPNHTLCGGIGSTDILSGGNCELTVAIGLEGDTVKGNSGLIQARQFKIGWPKRDSWSWDEAPGTFMIITGRDSCGVTNDGLFFATWNGSDWMVEKSGGCARYLVEKGHGPVIVHLGENKYKLYYEERHEQSNRSIKPFKMIYADGESSGNPGSVEFDDWESASLARDVHFLWPNGDFVGSSEESGLGDHMIFLPSNDLDLQYMIVNLSGGDNINNPSGSLGLGIAILINP